MNLIRCINSLLTGRLVPEKFSEAMTAGGVSSFADEIIELLKADGCAFLGQVKNCGVEVEQHPLLGPKTRPAPTQFQDIEGKVERLTVTQADLGAVVEFINFKPVLDTQAIGRIVNWGTILCWILSFYRTPDLLAMVKAMDMLPAPGPNQKGVGSKDSRSKLRNAL